MSIHTNYFRLEIRKIIQTYLKTFFLNIIINFLKKFKKQN